MLKRVRRENKHVSSLHNQTNYFDGILTLEFYLIIIISLTSQLLKIKPTFLHATFEILKVGCDGRVVW
jgi:hypothetical protein